MNWHVHPHTRAILLAVDPRLPDWGFEKHIISVEATVACIEDFCDEYDIPVPDTAICIDTEAQTVTLEQSPADRLRWYQILYKMQEEYTRLEEEGEFT